MSRTKRSRYGHGIFPCTASRSGAQATGVIRDRLGPTAERCVAVMTEDVKDAVGVAPTLCLTPSVAASTEEGDAGGPTIMGVEYGSFVVADENVGHVIDDGHDGG